MNWDLLSLLKQLSTVEQIDIDHDEIDEGFKSTDVVDESNAIYRVISKLLYASKDKSIGLRIGQLFTPNSLHGLGYLYMTAQNIKQACERICEFPNFYHNIVKFETHLSNGSFIFSVENKAIDPLTSAAINESALSLFYQYAIWLNHEPIKVSEIKFKNPPMNTTESYLKYFHRQPVFNSDLNCIYFDIDTALMPLMTSQPEYHATLYQHLQEKHEAMSMSFIDRVKSKIRHAINEGNLSRKSIADKVNLTEKTLERRLGKRNFSYQKLIDQIRLELANQYLSTTSLSIEEIAMRLGYADRTTFSKAYKKWTGKTPRNKQPSLFM